MRLEELASRPAVTCTRTATIADVAREMKEQEVGSVVVVDADGRPIGICTDRDLVVRALAAEWPPSTPIHRAMTHEVATMSLDTDVLQAGEVMGTWAYRRIPIVSDDGRVRGMVSLDDITVVLANETDRLAGVVRTERGRHRAGRAVDGEHRHGSTA
jgi:CBS domain-containing protein